MPLLFTSIGGIGWFDDELGFQDGDGGPGLQAYVPNPLGVAVGFGNDVLITDATPAYSRASSKSHRACPFSSAAAELVPSRQRIARRCFTRRSSRWGPVLEIVAAMGAFLGWLRKVGKIAVTP